tara:strand:+ start:73 stop:594 length:522 start_codon:yes stop_codon:yes gene_type:complete
MKVEKTKLPHVLKINLDVFEDQRGKYIETYNEKLYHDKGIKINFIQDDISVSKINVLRGLHGDDRTWKLISCLSGKFLLAVVNCNIESEDFGRWQTFTLSDNNHNQVLVPPKHANGHLVLSEKAIFHYKQSTYYEGAKNQFTYRWDEPKFGISWPITDPILSTRDDKVSYVHK